MLFFAFNTRGLLYAFRIILGCLIVWYTLYFIPHEPKIWGIISVIVISDPDYSILRQATISRVINTITGCLVGLLFVYFFGGTLLSLSFGIVAAIVIATSFKNYPGSWKLAPCTVTIIIMAAMAPAMSWHAAMLLALSRTGEVLYGSLVAFVLGYIFTRVRTWYQRQHPPARSDYDI